MINPIHSISNLLTIEVESCAPVEEAKELLTEMVPGRAALNLAKLCSRTARHEMEGLIRAKEGQDLLTDLKNRL